MLSYVLLCVSQFLFMVMRGTFLPSDTLHCFSSVAQWRLQATEHLICCEDVVELHPPVWKEEKQFDLPHSWLVNYLSFLAVIVSIDTTQHLTPTGLHNLMFLPGTHTSPHRHISTHTHTNTHTHTASHSLWPHALTDFASGELEVGSWFMGKIFSLILLWE